MNVAAIQNLARRITKTNTTTYTSANLLIDINIAYAERIIEILNIATDHNAQMEEAYTDLVSVTGLVAGNNGYNGEYAFPDDLLRPVIVKAKHDGENWRYCTPYEITDNLCDEITLDDINDNFENEHPYVRFERDSYFIRPLPETTVTSGLHVWYEKRRDDLTTGSPEFEEGLHQILAYDCAEVYALSNPNSFNNTWWNRFQTKQRKVQDKFQNFYKNRFRRNFKMTQAYPNYK